MNLRHIKHFLLRNIKKVIMTFFVFKFLEYNMLMILLKEN